MATMKRKARSVTPAEAERIQRLNALLDKYSAGLKPSTPPHQDPATQTPTKAIILTGSTGALGSYILDNLINSSSPTTITTIYCLNRSATAPDRQRLGNESRGLSTDFSRVRFLLADFSQPTLGLLSDVYAELLRTVTHVIHNAWMINLKLPVSFFETTHIAGVRHLIDFSNTSTRRARIVFTSTYGTAFHWWRAGHQGKVPEWVIDDPLVVDLSGYCEAKWVSEKLLKRAGEICGTRSCILRIGQIAGPTRHGDLGMWNESEFVPRLVKSSKYLGLVPRTFAARSNVDWCPLEVVADVVTEMLVDEAFGWGKEGPKVFHVVNPNVGSWEREIAPAMLRSIGEVDGVEGVRIVDYEEWVEALRKSKDAPAEDMVMNPALRLMGFFEAQQAEEVQSQERYAKVDDGGTGHPKYAMEGLLKMSKTLRECGPVTGVWMEQWMRQWRRHANKKDIRMSKLS